MTIFRFAPLVIPALGFFCPVSAAPASEPVHFFSGNRQMEFIFETPPDRLGHSRLIQGLRWEFEDIRLEKGTAGTAYQVRMRASAPNSSWELKNPVTGSSLTPDPATSLIEFIVPVNNIRTEGLLSAVSPDGVSVVERFTVILHSPKTPVTFVKKPPVAPAPSPSAAATPIPSNELKLPEEGDTFRNATGQIEVRFAEALASEGRSRKIPGLIWNPLGFSVEKQDVEGIRHYRVRIRGEMRSTEWTLKDAAGQLVPLQSADHPTFDLAIPVTQIETRSQLTASGPNAALAVEKFTIFLRVPLTRAITTAPPAVRNLSPELDAEQAPELQELPPLPSEPPPELPELQAPLTPPVMDSRAGELRSVSRRSHSISSFSIGAGYSNILITQSRNSLAETGVTAKAAWKTILKQNAWDIGGNVFYTAMPLSVSVPDTEARFLGANLRLTRQLTRPRSTLNLYLSFGGYYSTMFVTGPMRIGYRNVAGPQLYPSASVPLSSRVIAGFYFKYSPMMAGTQMLDLTNRELATGASLAIGKVSLAVDYANLALGGTYQAVQTSSTTFGLGVQF